MTDKKRLNAEVPGSISQKDIDAWKRDNGQAERNAKLKNLNGSSPEQAIKVLRLFAEIGDPHFISSKLNLDVAIIRKILKSFKINTIEDAKKLIDTGIISELDRASTNDRLEKDAKAKEDHIEGSKKLSEHNAAKSKKTLTTEEKDGKLQERRNDAQRKNKKEQIRSLIAQGLEKVTDTSQFYIEVKDIATFKSMIPHGVSQLQRRFGGSKKDIVSEIKRLSPTTDVDMLRP